MREIWFVSGDVEHLFFAQKIDAERWARVLFPSEAPDRRYARIYSRQLVECINELLQSDLLSGGAQ